MSGTQGASLEESLFAGQSIYIPMSKHFGMAKSSSCAMPRQRHYLLFPMRRLALVLVHRWELGGVRPYRSFCLESGMIISRRPKRRASSENAPGPSSASATQMIARFRWAMELVRAGVWFGGNRTKDMSAFPAAANPQQIGVRNPMRIETPVTTARPPAHQQEAAS